MKKKLLLVFLSTFLLLSNAIAQQITVSGKVTSEDGLIPGVSIKIKGSKTGTQTDGNGAYSLKALKTDILVFSYVGYLPKEELVGARTTINISLKSDAQGLNEVVVVGYGTQRKGNLTGAVTTVDVKKTLNGRPISDVGRALQGAASGLSVTVPSGEIGSDPVIKIRGQLASFAGASNPLILVDNVEIPSIQMVNPDDIASITILKDAAASSIYGAKAAFGVVLITTKQGSGSDKPSVTYSNNFSFQNVWKDLKMADVDGLKYTVDAAERVGTTTEVGAFYYVDRASYNKAVAWKEKYGSTIGSNDPTVYGRDWYVQGADNKKMGVRTYDPYDYMVKEWTPTQQHNLSIGGTSGKTSYNLGLGLLDQTGMIMPSKVDKFARYNASIKLSSEINKYVTVRGGAIYSRRNKQYAYTTNSTTADPWLYLYRWSSLYPMGKDENGDPIRSPESELAAANTANILFSYANVNLGTTVNIMKNWKVDFDYTFTNQNENWNRPGTRFTARNSWAAPKARLASDGGAVYVNDLGQAVASTTPGAMRAYDLSLDMYTANGSNPDHFARSTTNYYSHTINAFTTYNLKLKENHDFKFIAGVNRVTATAESQFGMITNLMDINNPQFRFGTGVQTVLPASDLTSMIPGGILIAGNNTLPGSDKRWEAQLGYFARVNYAFKNKYLLEANLRYDGSSKFPTDLQWRVFPSFSAGWVASEEKFMDWSKPFLNQLKFRGSWGSIGDQTVPNGLYVSTMSNGQSSWIGANGAKVAFVGSPAAIIADIRWQDIVTTNFGVDATFLQNKFNVSFDLFQRNTNNMIVPQEGIPLTFGVGAPQGNFGSLQTRGWEFSLDFNHRFKNGLGVNFKGNISDAKTVLTEYGSGTQVTNNYNGKNIGEIWGYRTDRLYQTSDFELDGSGKPILITLTAAESRLNAGKKTYKLKAGPNGEKPVYQPFLQNSANFYYGPGDVKFKDVNGDGEISNGDGTLANHGDLEVIGNTTPRYEYGFRLGADFKGFDISAFFQGVGSRKIWGAGFLAIPGFSSADGAMPQAIAGNYWTPQTPDAFYPAAYNNAASSTANNMQVQDKYLLNMAYIRLKNLTLGYTFPQLLTKKVNINSLRIYAALENFATWDHLGDLPIDPESVNGLSVWDQSNYNGGRTGTGVPAFKSVSFGLQLGF